MLLSEVSLTCSSPSSRFQPYSSSFVRFILKRIPLPGTIMVEKFTIADGRQRQRREGGTPMIERVEWADRKITGYAERRQTDGRSERTRTATRRNGHFGHELGECGVHIMARRRGGEGREVTKEIGPPFSEVVKVVRPTPPTPRATCDKTEASKVTGKFFRPAPSFQK